MQSVVFQNATALPRQGAVSTGSPLDTIAAPPDNRRPECRCGCGVRLIGSQRAFASATCRTRAFRASHRKIEVDSGALVAESSVVTVNNDPVESWPTFARRLKVPVGHKDAGKPLDLEWMIDPLGKTLSEREWFRVLITVARKNGKTTGVAALMAYAMKNLAIGWEGAVASIRRENAAETRRIIEGLSQMNHLDLTVFRNRITGERGGVTVASSHAGAGHSVGLNLAVFDEVGLAPPKMLSTLGALETALSARDGTLLGVSVRGDSPVIDEMIADPETCIIQHSAPEGCDLLDAEMWQLANPALGKAKSLLYMERQARGARLSKVRERRFRCLDLNQKGTVEGAQGLVTPEDWRMCQVSGWDEMPAATGPVVLGIDLGGSWSLTAAAALWVETGRLEMRYAVASEPNLEVRGEQDGDPSRYERAVEFGLVEVHAGRITDAKRFLLGVFDWLNREEILAIGADRYRRDEMLSVLASLDVEVPSVVWRGTGAGRTADGSHDVRQFIGRIVSGGRLRVWGSDEILTVAARDVRVRYDEGGNPALCKKVWTSRIDPIQAAVIAAGLAALVGEDQDEAGETAH